MRERLVYIYIEREGEGGIYIHTHIPGSDRTNDPSIHGWDFKRVEHIPVVVVICTRGRELN